jgi:Domain of unknown function (DUF4136)
MGADLSMNGTILAFVERARVIQPAPGLSANRKLSGFHDGIAPVIWISAQVKGIAMRFTKQLILLPIFLFIVACAYGQDVHYNYDRGANFSAYKTYKWIDIPGGAVPDQFIDHDIKRAIDEQLAQKGLTKAEKDPDLYVGYQASLREEKSINLWNTGGGGPWGWGSGPGWGGSTVQGQTSTIPVGTLFVDLYDRGKKQLIWRGDASKTLDLKKDPDKNYKNLQKAVAKLFKNYPPQPSK